MKILVTGSTGLIGQALVTALREDGDDVLRLARFGSQSADCVVWDPDNGIIDAAQLEGLDGVVHLAGENVAARRWSKSVKRKILESRTKGTTLLSETLARLSQPPMVFVSASAVGYYGNSGEAEVDEEAPYGDTFLSRVCIAWEAAADTARVAGIRVVHPRFGMVLSASGGALGRMLPFFRVGLGGRLGNGREWMSWVTLSDAVQGLKACIRDGRLCGAVNVVAPNPVTNVEFTQTLARILRRPALLPVPAPLVHAVFGEMGRELLLGSVRAKPVRLNQCGFQFASPEICGALQEVLNRGDGV